MGARKFVNNNYNQIKGANPNFPFIVRECFGAQPTVWARYDFGAERRVYLNDLDEEQVDAVVADLVEQSGNVNAAMPGH